MPEKKTLALLDASGYLYRAFHAIRPLSAPDGRPTNATFGFATMLRKLLSQRKPDAVAVCFDRPEKTFRHEMDPQYKATRAAMPDDLVPQVADVKALCRAMGLAVVEEPGFEADDLIGTLAEKGARAGLVVEVVSADKDLFQLVREGAVSVWHPVHEKLLDSAGVAELFGAPPERVTDVLGLMGDSSDNIPGVRGIGEKGAKELVATFGPLEEIYARVGELKGKRREALEAGRDDAFRSRELATVRRDAPVPGGGSAESLLETFAVPPASPEGTAALAAFFGELGFSRLKKELLEAAGATAPRPAAKPAGSGSLFGEEDAEAEAGRAYLGPRARIPLELGDVLLARLTARPASLRVYEELELPLVPVLSRMELAGILVDPAALSVLSVDLGARLAALEAEIHAAAGEPFNVGSPLQLGRILFEKLGYPALKKTAKTKSYATGSEILEELTVRGFGPLPGLVLEWRELSKLKGTYVDALPKHVAKDGRIHTRFDQAVAATGRLSSNDPNLQNIPVRTEAGRAIRKAFVAPKGRLLVSADYSQVELRLLAHLSGDEALIETFRRGDDIHRATAARIFGIHPDLVSPDQRRGAKTINFGILYGMGPFALAGQLGVTQGEAKAFIAAYFQQFPSIRACLDRILARARETGATETIFGRLRPIPGIADRNHAVRANAERMAMNAPFQGSAADLIKKAMVDLDARLAAELPSARMLLQVHDELVLECDEGDAARAADLARETMEGAASLAVPLTVETARGADWAAAK